MRSFIISWFLFVETSGLLYKELETTRTFYTIVEFLWTYFIYFIYILYVRKNWNKGCIFYFFKFSRMLCWKNYEMFSWRIMMNIMPIITDLLKKMGYLFQNLVPCECTLLSLLHCDQKEKYSKNSKYKFLYILCYKKAASRRLDLKWLYCYNQK